MISPVVINGLILVPDDNGLQVFHNGTLVKYEPPAPAQKNNGFWKTLLIIAHRLTTIRTCDIVYEIKDGRVRRAR